MRTEISPSIIVAKRSPRSTIVTLDPSARQIVANSMPTAPPPTMTIALGAPRSRYRMVSVSKTPGMSNAPPFGRCGRDPVAIKTHFACKRCRRTSFARNANRALAIETRLPLDVVDVASQDVFLRKILELRTDVPRSRANYAHREFRWNRHAQAVDVRIPVSGNEERRFAQRLRRRPAGRGDRPSGSIPFDDRTPQAEERRQLGRTFPGRSRTNRDQIVRFAHGLTLRGTIASGRASPRSSS